ncbi:MAG: hypothetical protein HXY44_17485 [Syntrophaceae bacterium]|nr:hypothetical protein [Syntrophaceae bacterium]
MGRGTFVKGFVYFLCISFLLLTNGFHQVIAEAKDVDRPVGEMFSKGEVKVEVKENIWKKVEPSHFPIFKGGKVKTEKGEAIIKLTNGTHLELKQHTLLSFDQDSHLDLFNGQIHFRVKPDAEINFRVGNLSIVHSKPLQASKGAPTAPLMVEETIGSIFIHANGAVTVKSLQGPLTILDQSRVVVAALSSKDSVTVPSTTVKSAPKVMVAQAGGTGSGKSGDDSDTTIYWVIGGVLAAGAAGVGIWALAKGGGGGDGGLFFCRP